MRRVAAARDSFRAQKIEKSSQVLAFTERGNARRRSTVPHSCPTVSPTGRTSADVAAAAGQPQQHVAGHRRQAAQDGDCCEGLHEQALQLGATQALNQAHEAVGQVWHCEF